MSKLVNALSKDQISDLAYKFKMSYTGMEMIMQEAHTLLTENRNTVLDEAVTAIKERVTSSDGLQISDEMFVDTVIDTIEGLKK